MVTESSLFLSLRSDVSSADKSHVAGYLVAIGEAARVPQEHLRRQCRHWSHTRMRQQAERLGPLLDLFFHLPVQLLDPLLQRCNCTYKPSSSVRL